MRRQRPKKSNTPQAVGESALRFIKKTDLFFSEHFGERIPTATPPKEIFFQPQRFSLSACLMGFASLRRSTKLLRFHLFTSPGATFWGQENRKKMCRGKEKERGRGRGEDRESSARMAKPY
uniref:Uncharacterized protein n=1 Tax=Anthoceros angustus TaxID=48387 RepID=A0A2P1L4W1_ANTAG|nr:hypothetical protein AnanMp15 [Anthoceros angustus]AVP12848.1 hypothetical protein AnanMp15 [Anthoceros angustus]